MLATYKLTMDLWDHNVTQRIEAVQDDNCTRAIAISLYSNGEVWPVPEGITAIVRYRKSDGTGGEYDTMPDGVRAWSTEGNVLTIFLAPQVLTVEGPVYLDVLMLNGSLVLSTFRMILHVHNSGISREDSWDYSKITGFMPLPQSAGVDEVIVVKAVGSDGRPTAVETKPYAVAQEVGGSDTVLMSQKAITDAIAQAMQGGPLFANDISECTDTSRVYLLPDGYLYVYMRSTKISDPNMFDPNAATLNVRLNSSGAEVAESGSYATGYISVDLTALDPYIVRLPLDFHGSYGNQRAILYDANKNLLQNCYINNDGDGDLVSHVYTGSDGRYYIKLGYTGTTDAAVAPDSSIVAAAKYVRFSILTTESGTALVQSDLEDVSIRFDALYVEEDTYTWCNTGRAYQPADYEDRIIVLEDASYDQGRDLAELSDRVEVLEKGSFGQLPDYWTEYLPEKIRNIQTLQEHSGKDCFSFPVLTDIHIPANLGQRSGLVAKAVMDACDLRYALCLGDVVTRGTAPSVEALEESFRTAEALLSPIRSRLLQTQGNHDGAWGAVDLDADGDVEGEEYYCYNFAPEKLHRFIYRKVGLVGDVHFDDSGSGYYLDDVSQKVRYIILNSHCHTAGENADGSAANNTMRLFRFRQCQYDLVVEALNSVPGDDWAVVTASHAPLNDSYEALFGGSMGDHVLMRKLLAAYKAKINFSGTFPGTYGDDAVTVNADFTDAKGEFIAHFAGHCHADTDGTFDGITVVTTRCDAHEENDQTSVLYTERVAGTVTEQSFDVITVDRASRTIHATKIGAGEDRTIAY